MSLNWNVLLIVVAATIVGLSSVYIFKLPPNNSIEEAAEEVIKKETGIDIELDLLEKSLICDENEPMLEENVKEV